MILTAVLIEARAIARAMGLKPASDRDAKRLYWENDAQWVAVIPVGIRAAHLDFVAMLQPSCVLLAGFAGALEPSLKIGDVLMDDCPIQWRDGFEGRLGRLCCSGRLIHAAAQKKELHETTGALAVDMESAIVRQWAFHAGLPFVSIRAISDTAEQDLNPAILRFIDDMGRLKPAALAAGLSRNPMLLSQLLRLATASKTAGRNLGQAVRGMVERISRT